MAPGRSRTGGRRFRAPRVPRDLRGVGPATARDLERLGIRTVKALAAADPDALFVRLRELAGGRLDPCVLDVLRCAVAQARDPDLPAERRDWWWWSRARKGGRLPPVPS